jgi:hypothetical protein
MNRIESKGQNPTKLLCTIATRELSTLQDSKYSSCAGLLSVVRNSRKAIISKKAARVAEVIRPIGASRHPLPDEGTCAVNDTPNNK